MNYQILKQFSKGIPVKSLSEIQYILEELGEAFQFQPGTFLPPKMIKEAEITINEIYADLVKNRKKILKLTNADEEVLDQICGYSSGLSEMAQQGQKGKEFYMDAKKLGRKLNQFAKKISKFTSVVIALTYFHQELIH